MGTSVGKTIRPVTVPVSFADSDAVLSLLLAAKESGDALAGLSTFDGGDAQAVYCEYLLVLLEDDCYTLNSDETDELSGSQKQAVKSPLQLFQAWWTQ